MNRKSLSAFFITVVVICKPVFAAPTFEISTSSKVAEKGHTFQIFIEMKTNEPIYDIVISITEPEGFHIEAIDSPGITAEDEEATNLHSIVKINRLGQNSAVTAAFKVWPPNLAGNPKIGDKQSLYSTREPKTFPINIFYKTESDAGEIDGMYTEKISIKYTTSIGHYIVAGLFGVILGYIVKVSTQYKQEITDALKNSNTVRHKIRTFMFEVLIARLPLLLTLLIVGFGVLLSLAKDGLPTASWHQAIALGIGIGILSDEQLITKIKKYKV